MCAEGKKQDKLEGGIGGIKYETGGLKQSSYTFEEASGLSRQDFVSAPPAQVV